MLYYIYNVCVSVIFNHHCVYTSAFYTVVNMSLVIFAGEPVVVPEDIQVTIDCGRLINETRDTLGVVANITWKKNGRIIVNDSEINVVLSPDNSTLFITDTLLGTPAQVGTNGLYECEVCGGNACVSVNGTVDPCSKYSLTWPDHFISFILR